MKILTIHSDFIEFEPLTKAIGSAEEVAKEKKRVEECLVVFASVEKSDEINIRQVAENAIAEISAVMAQVKTNKVVVYPFVHLSSTPSSPSAALDALKQVESGLKAKGFEVARAPFGWYKSFTVKCKGHPLSELSREIKPVEAKRESGEKLTISGEPVSEALKKESELKSRFYILTPEGELVEVEKFKFGPATEKLKIFSGYEIKKERAYSEEPPHVRLMKELKIADHEPGSDAGNLRWYPNGRLIKRLIEKYVTERVQTYGGIEVETPLMYDFEHPALKNYLNRFPARQYIVKSDVKDYFLRFAACFGQFLMMKDTVISYKHLPLKVYELTRYSFRREQSGEVAGMRRLRAFTMPDCHAFCADIDQAKNELLVRFDLAYDIQKTMGLDPKEDLELAVRVTKDFWENNKDYVVNLVKKWGKPALIEMWNERIFYFVLKYEFNFVDSLGKASALTTDQIDIENGERYGITYVDAEGKRRPPIILHLSPSGAVERIIYGLLEQQAMKAKKGNVPMLPLWLSPTQVRIIPVASVHLDFAKELAEQFELNAIRVDIDDREETLQRKVRDAEKEWVPFILVVGEKEKQTKKFQVRVRGAKEPQQATLEELIVAIRKKIEAYPFERLALPKFLTKRPIFAG